MSSDPFQNMSSCFFFMWWEKSKSNGWDLGGGRWEWCILLQSKWRSLLRLRGEREQEKEEAEIRLGSRKVGTMQKDGRKGNTSESPEQGSELWHTIAEVFDWHYLYRTSLWAAPTARSLYTWGLSCLLVSGACPSASVIKHISQTVHTHTWASHADATPPYEKKPWL